MIGGWLWLLVPLAPLLTAALLPLLGRRLLPWIWLSCLPALLTSAWPAPPLVLEPLWPAAVWQATDQLTRGWLGFTALLWAAASLFAAGEVEGDQPRRFFAFWLVSMSGNFLLVVAGDVLSFYVGFTAMSMAAYGLVVHRGGPKPRRAGRIYLQLAVTGEMILFGAIAMRSVALDGSLLLADWQNLPVEPLTLILLLVGFGLKIGFWPLHFWLPLAHPTAPAPASAVLSGAMIEAGLLGLWRMLPADDPLLQQWAGTLLVLGLISAFYGVLNGLISSQAKAALAYSSISQMGYLLVVLALAWRHPEHLAALSLLLTVFVAHHGLAKGALFLSSGLHPSRPGVWLLVVIPALAIAGLPLTSGGAAKGDLQYWLKESDFAHLSFALKLASMGTTLLLARALWLMKLAAEESDGHRRGVLIMPWALLCVAPVLMPWLWPAFREMLLHHLSWSGVWTESWPIAVALLLSWIALRRNWRVPETLRHWHTPALHVSIRLQRLLVHPPIPVVRPELNRTAWRGRERRWNRFWNQRSIIASTAWLLTAVFLTGAFWMLV
jgi:hydrogenase-4 component B